MGSKTQSIFYGFNGERLKFSLHINEDVCVCVRVCERVVVIGRQSDVGAHKEAAPVVASATDG